MILVKYIAESGVLSRRKSEEAIKNGYITINGHKIKDPTYEVKITDNVFMGNRKIFKTEHIYIVMNKPTGYITSKGDPEGRPNILNLLPKNIVEKLDPVGRLDFNTSGVLLLTSDGSFAYKLSHPKFEVKKIYQVIASKPLTKKIIDSLIDGIKLEDGLVTPDNIKWNEEAPTHFSIELHSGKYRIIRRLLKIFGIFVKKLHRSSFAGINVKGLQFGDFRPLTKTEISKLVN
jgi:23S rRNA pseudouridine2605 synthase